MQATRKSRKVWAMYAWKHLVDRFFEPVAFGTLHVTLPIFKALHLCTPGLFLAFIASLISKKSIK